MSARWPFAFISNLEHKFAFQVVYETFTLICYHLFNLRNVKNTHGRVMLFIKLQASAQSITCVAIKSMNWYSNVFCMLVEIRNESKLLTIVFSFRHYRKRGREWGKWFWTLKVDYSSCGTSLECFLYTQEKCMKNASL